MDFDASAFLSVDMSEDENAVYTDFQFYPDGLFVGCPESPDLIEPEDVNTSSPTMTVFGGLEMEQTMQIPVPVFDTLNVHSQEDTMDYEGDQLLGESLQTMSEILHVDVSNLGKSTVPQNSPLQTSSPHAKKIIIPTSTDESRFRKDFFCGDYERVKLFRLHCTICDKHLGCAPGINVHQMRMHKLFNVAVCRKCFEFYGDVNFPIEDDSELYCCWCGQGGEVFCCSKCPKIVCKKCVKRNLGASKVKEIEENDNWLCFVCDPVDIWPHRAIFWGMQRLAKELRQSVLLLPKSEQIEKLSKDTSHCCLKLNEIAPTIVLPRKNILSKVPLPLIAFVHQSAVRNQPDQQTSQNLFIRATSQAINKSYQPYQKNAQNIFIPTPPSTKISDLINHTRPQMFGVQVPMQNVRGAQSMMLQHKGGFQTPNRNFRMNQPMHNGSALNRPSPYPVSKQAAPMHVFNPRNQLRGVRPSFNSRNISKPSQPELNGEIIDLVEDTPSSQPLVVPQIVNHDVSWLEKGMRDIKETMSPVTMMLDHFPLTKTSLQQDFTKLTNFSDRLTYNIKIAICNLAKINQDLIDASKTAIDDKVSTIVRDQINGLSNKSISLHKITSSVDINLTKPNPSQEKKPETVTSEKPQFTVTSEKPNPCANPSPPTEDFNPALLCETVLQEGNKENKTSNKPETSLVKPALPVKKRGRPRSIGKSNSKMLMSYKVGSKLEIPIIDLDNEEEREINSDKHDVIQKYNIKPCKIVLQRMKTPLKTS